MAPSGAVSELHTKPDDVTNLVAYLQSIDDTAATVSPVVGAIDTDLCQ